VVAAESNNELWLVLGKVYAHNEQKIEEKIK
jgi:hypothetical protein